MAVKGGPDIITEGLVFHLDAAGAISGKGYDPEGLRVEYLIVGGGGGGGGSPHGAGGGAGGLLYGRTIASHGANSIVIGAGGSGKIGKKTAPWPPAGTNYGANGGNSTAFGKTALGGGGGGGYSGSISNDTVGKNGGSGGGTGRDPVSVGQATQPSSSDGGYGNNGGRGGYSFGYAYLYYNQAGGGGGAGARGNLKDSYIETEVSKGGIGRYYGYIFGRSLGDDGWFAGGGGGSFWSSSANQNLEATASLGGGGRGAHGNLSPSVSNPVDGMVNTGGGGGGSERHPSGDGIGGEGGSGIVLIKYKGPQRATGGDSIITRNGFTIHVFTSSGTFTVGDRVAGLSTNKIVGSLENMGSNDYKTGNKGYFSFDGSNQAIKLPNFDVSTLGGNFTICSLIKPIGSISLVFSSLDVSLSSQTKNINFYFYEAASYGISSNAMRLQFGKDIWAWQVYGSNGLSLLKNNWYFVAVTAANLNTNTHTIKFYVNDQSVNATKWQFGSPTPINYGGDISNSTFLARSYSASDPTQINTYYEINIANVKIYNKTLSDNEVLDNYNATKGRYGL